MSSLLVARSHDWRVCEPALSPQRALQLQLTCAASERRYLLEYLLRFFREVLALPFGTTVRLRGLRRSKQGSSART
jgi:hypothetical protein